MKALIVNLSPLSSSSSFEFFTSNTSTNVKTFFSFENSEIMINNLINRFLIHSLIFSQMTPFQIDMKVDQNIIFLQISLKNDHFLDLIHISMKKIDSFIYMIIDRYTSEKFYELMIDSETSRIFTAKYEEYLAYHKNNKNDVMNISKTETIHVQFEIESI
jgi:SUMO ligase MMS21 Smc5/6 complex component